MSETLGLKNVNMMSYEMYANISDEDIKRDELYAISGSGFGFPSDRYDDLELGASGTEYTAPANGFFILNKVAGAVNTYVNLRNITKNLILETNGFAGTGSYGTVMMPAQKGDIVKASYNATGTTNIFRFIYAEGE